MFFHNLEPEKQDIKYRRKAVSHVRTNQGKIKLVTCS